jgi:TPR repeat protein
MALLAALVLGVAFAGVADIGKALAAGGRQALVIGNQAYAHLPPLDNPALDAHLLAATLERRGFNVERVIDGNYEAMRAAISRFRLAAEGAEVALVYYAGHGVQVDGVNYLFPVGADVQRREDLQREAVMLPLLLHELERAAPEVGILVLDACRDNPVAVLEATLAQQSTRSLRPRQGLAPVESATGLLIAYATAPGQVALDGPAGGNSPYAEALARYLDEPGLEIGILFRKVSAAVRAATAGSQVPWTEASLTGEPLVLYPDPGAGTRDAIAELNRALDESDPSRQRLALSRFVEANAGTPAAELAKAYLAENRTMAAAVAIADPVSLETTLAAWQRVNLMASTVAEGFAGELFATLHGSAPSSIGGQLAGPRTGSVVGAEAAELLWPLVQASGRTSDYERYLDLFPNGPRSEAATTAFELASLTLPTAGPATGAEPMHGTTRRLSVVVGTGPVTLPLPEGEAPIVLVESPRHGRLRAFDAAGGELQLGDEPTRVARLRYEPPLVLRTGVDTLALAAVTPAAVELGRPRSLEPVSETPAGETVDGQSATVEGALPAASATMAALPSVAASALGERLVVQLEIGVHACDRQASTRFDTQGVVLGLFRHEIDAERAIRVCESAVAQFPEVARFHYHLGTAIDEGGDPEAAVPHYRRAAALGHWQAVNRLGFFHETGRGLPIDFAEARALYEKAAARGDTHAMNNLGRVYRDGDVVPADRDKAIDWFLASAANGNSYAYNNLGYMLLDEGDTESALPLFEQAAAAGDIYGHNNLGHVYQNGIGVDQDVSRAIEHYEAAAEGGQPNAPINLGFIYRDGAPGVAPDLHRAAFWFAEAAKVGNPWGSVHLAGLHAEGALTGTPNPELAAKLLARVAWLDAQTARYAESQNYGGAGQAAFERFAELPVDVVVRAVQLELARLGFDPGPADGLPGARTNAALDAFLAANEPPLPTDLPPIEILAELVRRPAA